MPGSALTQMMNDPYCIVAMAVVVISGFIALAVDCWRKYGRSKISYVKIVRCKDCKYCDSEIRDGIKFAKCELNHNWMPQPNWFCADGENGEGEMKYRFYHEWLYRIADKLSSYHLTWARRYVGIMRKMRDRLKASVEEVK